MNPVLRPLLPIILLSGLGLSACNDTSKTSAASATAADTIVVKDARIRASTVPGQKVTGAFMSLENPGDTPFALISVQTDSAKVAELHETRTQGELMQMQQVDQIEIPAKHTVELKPGSFHIMLIDLKQALPDGTSTPLTLTFSDKSQKKLDVPAIDMQKMP